MKKKLIALISFLCYIICWVQAADEHYYFKNLSIQDGLSQTLIPQHYYKIFFLST